MAGAVDDGHEICGAGGGVGGEPVGDFGFGAGGGDVAGAGGFAAVEDASVAVELGRLCLAEGGDAGHPGDGAIGDFAGDAGHEWGEGGDEA